VIDGNSPLLLFLDGIYTKNKQGLIRFRRTIALNQQELAILVHSISHRVARYLEHQGILERDEENSYLQLDGIDEDPMQQLIGCSVSYRIAVRPQQGRKVFSFICCFINDGYWLPKIDTHYYVARVCLGHFAAPDVSILEVSFPDSSR
jgi:hypothetical protein